MTKAEVIKKIGKKNWDKFCKWIYGQTMGLNSDGSFNYYKHDVEAFATKLKTGYDRQEDPGAWD